MEFVYAPPKTPRYTLVHADDDIVVVDKPAGLLSVPGRAAEHKDCLETRVQQDFPTARIVHRLDMATSGLLILPLHRAAHAHLQKQFEARTIEKAYQAIVAGHLEQACGVVQEPLMTDWPNRPKQKICYEQGKSATTHYQVIAPLKVGGVPATRVALHPITGRTHQLRVHMCAIGHPILGDRLYATGAQVSCVERLMLQAQSITLTHPHHHERQHFSLEPAF